MNTAWHTTSMTCFLSISPVLFVLVAITLILEYINYKHIHVILAVNNYLLQVSVSDQCHRQALAPEWPEAAGSARCWLAAAVWAEAGLTAGVHPALPARVRRWARQEATWSERLSHGAHSTPPFWTVRLQSKGLGRPERQKVPHDSASNIFIYL